MENQDELQLKAEIDAITERIDETLKKIESLDIFQPDKARETSD